MKIKTKDLVNMALLAALAYVVMLVIHIKMFEFLSLEFKDVVIAISGFIYGPVAVVIISFVVAFLEMITVSTTGVIGFIMNFLACLAFALPAALIYHHKKTLNNAIIGLVVGSVTMIITMILLNLVFTPLYTGMSRAEVMGMIVPILLPFNVIKAVLNSCFIMLLYKPLVKALNAIGLLKTKHESSSNKLVIFVCLVLIALMVLLVLKINHLI